MKIDLHFIKNANQLQKDLYMTCIGLVETVINSKTFKSRVLEYKWIDDNGVVHGRFKENNGLNNEGVYNLFMSGKDKFNPLPDGDLDLAVELYNNKWSRVKGYTYGNTYLTWINVKFWKGIKEKILALIGGNLVHEYLHNVGFGHAFKFNSTRKHSVNYAIGRIVEELILNILEFKQSDYKYVCSGFWIFKRCRWVKI